MMSACRASPSPPSRSSRSVVDDAWHDGTLEAWRRDGDRWRGYVRWSVGVGMRRLGWVDASAIRRA